MNEVAMILPDWGRDFDVDHSKSVDVLGVNYTEDLNKEFTDMCYSLIESGVI